MACCVRFFMSLTCCATTTWGATACGSLPGYTRSLFASMCFSSVCVSQEILLQVACLSFLCLAGEKGNKDNRSAR